MAERGPKAVEQEDLLKLEEFLPYRLARVAELISQDFATVYRAREGMTRPEWRVLATIGQFGCVTASFIGQHSSMHKTKVSRAVTSLEQRGWVTRKMDPHDRRSEQLSLTSRGRTQYRNLISEARAFQQTLQMKIAQAAPDGSDQNFVDALASVETVYQSRE